MDKGDESRKRKRTQKPAIMEPKLTRHNRGMELQNSISDDSAEPTPIRELIEDVLIYLVPFVKFNEGIEGLYRLRLVSKNWNDAMTRILPEKNVTLDLKKGRLAKFMAMQSACNEDSIGRIAFKSIYIRENRQEDNTMQLMRSFLVPDQHWTYVLTKLKLEDFNVLECNEMMERIIPSLPKLQTLTLVISMDVDNFNIAQGLAIHPRPESCWSETNIAANNIRNQSLKTFSLDWISENFEHVTLFDWNFIRACPNMESLDISFASYRKQPPKQLYQSVVTELIKLPPLKLKNLKLGNGEIWRCDQSNIVQAFADLVNHFQPVTLQCSSEHSVLREFIQKIPEGCVRVQELNVMLASSRHDDAQEELMHTLCSTIIHAKFENLRVLVLCISGPIISGSDVELPVLENVQEFNVSTIMTSNIEMDRRSRHPIHRIIRECFPNLQILSADVETNDQTQDLLASVANLHKLWYLTIVDYQDYDQKNSPSYFEDYSRDNKGLRGLTMLTHLRFNPTFARIITYKVFIDFVAMELPKLKVLRLDSLFARHEEEVRDYAREKLVKGRKICVKFLDSDDLK